MQAAINMSYLWFNNNKKKKKKKKKNVLFYILRLQIGAYGPLQSKEPKTVKGFREKRFTNSFS